MSRTSLAHRFSLAPLAALAVAGCSALGSDDSTGPTYWTDVQPILAARCEGCHSAGGIGPVDLSSYAKAKETASAIVAVTASRAMPPWLPAEGIAYKGERRLSDEEIATLRTWSQAGAPEGDPAKRGTPLTSDIPTITPNLEVAMKAPYTPDKSLGSDDYRCFVLDPKLTEDRAVTGFDIRPGDKRVVHHVILFSVKPSELPALQRREDGTPGEGYTCFGDARVDAEMVGAWVPGTTATVFPDGTGVVLPAGGRLVMQVHYNLLEVQDTQDTTTALLETRATANVTPALIFPIGDDEFAIPPGEIGSVKRTFDTRDLRLPPGIKGKLHGSAPHMHLHGKSLKVEIEKADGTRIDVIDVPKWDFHWQQFYFYEEPFELVYGDKVHLECTWDNREQSQPIINGVRQPAKTLTWGEGTLEEMCLNFFYATTE